MEDSIDNIPDENVQIISPKKCIFLLNKKNMLINLDRKKINYKEYKNKNKEKDKSDNSSEESNAKTIIKEPGILTSNLLIDIKSLIKSKNHSNKNKINNEITKLKKKPKVSLSKKIQNKENKITKNNMLINSNNNREVNINKNIHFKNINDNFLNRRKINNKKNHYEINLTNSPKSKNLDNYKNQDIYFSSIKLNAKKNILDDKDKQSKSINDKNIIFSKKLSKEFQNKEKRNSLYISKKKEEEKQTQKLAIITKKILIRPELLAEKKDIERNIIYKTQKNLLSNYNINNEILINTDSGNNINFSKSKKCLLEEKKKIKSRIYLIDYFNNKKRELTNVIFGLNIIKDIIYKKLKKIFMKLKQNSIYKRKIINNLIITPKQKKYNNKAIYKNNNIDDINDDKKYNSIEGKNIRHKCLNQKIYDSISKSYQTMPNFCELYQTKTNFTSYKIDNYINEFHKMIEKKTRNNMNKKKNNRVILLNPNSYINNCNINSIQINLFKNEYINDSKNNNKNNYNKIIVKNISNKNIKKLIDNNDKYDIIKTTKTS